MIWIPVTDLLCSHSLTQLSDKTKSYRSKLNVLSKLALTQDKWYLFSPLHLFDVDILCFGLFHVRASAQSGHHITQTEMKAAAQSPVSQAVPSNQNTCLQGPLGCLAVVATWSSMRRPTWAMWRMGHRAGRTWCALSIAASPSRPSTSAPAQAPQTARFVQDMVYVLVPFNPFFLFLLSIWHYVVY